LGQIHLAPAPRLVLLVVYFFVVWFLLCAPADAELSRCRSSAAVVWAADDLFDAQTRHISDDPRSFIRSRGRWRSSVIPVSVERDRCSTACGWSCVSAFCDALTGHRTAGFHRAVAFFMDADHLERNTLRKQARGGGASKIVRTNTGDCITWRPSVRAAAVGPDQ